MGVAEWRTRLVESLPKKLQSSLPTVKQIEAELAVELQPTKVAAHAPGPSKEEISSVIKKTARDYRKTLRKLA